MIDSAKSNDKGKDQKEKERTKEKIPESLISYEVDEQDDGTDWET